MRQLQEIVLDDGLEIDRRQSADQIFGELLRSEAVQVAANFVDQALAHFLGHDLLIENPLLGVGNIERFGQQLVFLDHVDAAVAHLGDEIIVVALGVRHPGKLIEEQRIRVGGSQPGVGQSGRADEHFAKRAHFRVDAKGRGGFGSRVRHMRWVVRS